MRNLHVKEWGIAFAALFALSLPAMAETAPGDVAFADGAVEQSLTGGAGDAENGRAVFVDRSLGNCVTCHANSDVADVPFHGEVGPTLDGVADRWTEAELRGLVVNSKMMFEGTIMPGFYVKDPAPRVREDLVGKTILTASEVEDVVAYLMTLKD